MPETKADTALAAAIEVARAAAVEVGSGTVGEHLGVHAESERVLTHAFASTQPGYAGWHWAVTLTRAPRSRTVTVDEVVMLPGDRALLAPAWVPWDQRVQPGDIGPGDLLPPDPADPRLVPAYAAVGGSRPADAVDVPASEDRVVAAELFVGRMRVMSREGRLDAADRWFAGDGGPDTPMARQAPAHCGTCGFFLPLGGSLAAGFGVCGNEVTGRDGQVVSVEYGCGAHSEVKVTVPALSEPGEIVYDDGDVAL